jgi:hypothetical protein
LGISFASPSRQYAAALFVVPRSIPISIYFPPYMILLMIMPRTGVIDSRYSLQDSIAGKT